jgi:hypothetical protein
MTPAGPPTLLFKRMGRPFIGVGESSYRDPPDNRRSRPSAKQVKTGKRVIAPRVQRDMNGRSAW